MIQIGIKSNHAARESYFPPPDSKWIKWGLTTSTILKIKVKSVVFELIILILTILISKMKSNYDSTFVFSV